MDPASFAMMAGGAVLGQLFQKKPEMESPPPMAAPPMSPTGSQDSSKPKAVNSNVASAAPPAGAAIGRNTLLGQ